MRSMLAIMIMSLSAFFFQQAIAKPTPKVPSNLDKKYRTTGDTREVVTYTRISDHVCNYPHDKFDCTSIAGQNTTVATYQCGVCTWLPVGFGKKANSGGVNFCSEDGSSYIKIHYGDRECQDYQGYPGEHWPNEEVKSASASEPTCNFSGMCSNETPPVWCDLRDWNPGCDADEKCDHNPPACTGGCCPPAGGAGSESLHVELGYWKIQEQAYVCGASGSCAPSSQASKGGLLADCQMACAKPSEGRYACTDGHCVPTAGFGISLAKCQTVCPAESQTVDSLATLQI